MYEPGASSASMMAAAADNLTLPVICIPHVKMTIGRDELERPLTSHFIREAFSRYGEIENVVMKIRSRNCDSYDRKNVEQYYHVYIHFKRWRIENGEARYVRSVLLSPNPMANIKLSYDGPWYWKFYAARVMQSSSESSQNDPRKYLHQPKLCLQLEE
jgi:hypothetical protein